MDTITIRTTTAPLTVHTLSNSELRVTTQSSALTVHSYGVGATGPAGASAYELALKDGFVGTEQEWLASLYAKQTAWETSDW